MHEQATTEAGLRSWHVRAFLAAEAASAIGTWATIVAIWGYAAFEFDATAGDVAWFGIAFSLPPVLLGPVSGSTIDRFGPRRVLAGTKVLGAVASPCQLTGILVAGVLVGAHGVPTTVLAIGAFVVVVAAGLTRSHARTPAAMPVVDPAPVG